MRLILCQCNRFVICAFDVIVVVCRHPLVVMVLSINSMQHFQQLLRLLDDSSTTIAAAPLIP
jgi:hypothetical protein